MKRLVQSHLATKLYKWNWNPCLHDFKFCTLNHCPVVTNAWKEDAGSLNAVCVASKESEIVLSYGYVLCMLCGAIRESLLKEEALYGTKFVSTTCFVLGAGNTK